MYKLRTFTTLLFTLLITISTLCADEIDLSGNWQFQTDINDVGITESWYTRNFGDTIHLPGSMAENLKGNKPDLKTQWTGSLYDSSFYYNPKMEKYRKDGNIKFPFFLTPDRHYVGPAWYKKSITIPADWKSKTIILYLERPHYETRIWVDNIEAGKDSSLCVPHTFNLSKYLVPGKHTITMRIDNRLKVYNVGQDSHSVTDQTQGNWNGVVGKMCLIKNENIFLENIQVFPDLSSKKALVKFQISNFTGRSVKAIVEMQAKSFNSSKNHLSKAATKPVTIPAGNTFYELEIELGEGMLTWDEFNPALYNLETRLISGSKKLDNKETTFGMREISINGKWFYLNGRKIQLRGTVENCCFPLTGYAPMDIESWERVFRICKKYGLNHMRFHSFCPPEAAFKAADLVGFYLQAEGPSWPNHGSSLGDGKPIDKYLIDETIRITSEYGNHPSFVMLASGNEPRGRWVAWVTEFVKYWKKTDSRRVYTGASVGGSWAWQPGNQYHVKAGARGLSWDAMPESNSDYRNKIDTVSVPYISHETGQWCAFPDFNEIKKYTGVNKAKNFELFQENLSENDMGLQGHDFLIASGKLQTLCYKHEIEKTLRTPDYAGFQLLSLNDYSGQGTALVGVLNVFWEEKGYCNSSDFRKFCGPVVPLIRTSKFVYQTDEHLTADVELSYFGENSYEVIKPEWILKDEFGAVLLSGKFDEKAVETGNNIPLEKIDIDLAFIDKAKKVNLEIKIGEVSNDWDFYIYPSNSKVPSAGNVLIAYEWNEDIKNKLINGNDVLLMAAGRVEYGKDVVQTLTPVFWNTSWFKMRPPHTTGLLINPNHPVFSDFPTDDYADIRWWEIMYKTQVMQLTDFPKGFTPLIQPIDTWFLNRKLGMLIETKAGKGRLIISSIDLVENLQKRPVARQLYISILNYMNSIKFRPEYTVDFQTIDGLFKKASIKNGTYTKDAPDELKPELFKK
jgi:hypothetical protein